MADDIEVRRLSPSEVHLALDWARQEGWNPGRFDAACFHAADPDGFFASLHDGEPVAVVSVVRYGDRFAFLGLYICRPDLRGRGYGMRVWRAGMEYAADRIVGLDGVPAQQGNYAKSGFALAWRNARYRGTGGGAAVLGLVDLDTLPFEQVARYDRAVFEADRRRFLRVWLAQPDAVRLGIVRDSELVAWGLMRSCAEGRKIGPLFADGQDDAQRLLDGFFAAAAGEPVFLDVPEPNEAANRAARERGMEPVFETARMYTGPRPELALDKVWGITSFELG